jgi:hypothetical protein
MRVVKLTSKKPGKGKLDWARKSAKQILKNVEILESLPGGAEKLSQWSESFANDFIEVNDELLILAECDFFVDGGEILHLEGSEISADFFHNGDEWMER